MKTMKSLQTLKSSIIRVARASAIEVAALAALASPALAQQIQNRGGGDAPFAKGITTGLNWVYFGGVAIALVGFIVGCALLANRNPFAAGAAFFFVVIGAALLANANAILTTLTGLGFA
jgi:hypothetical protein